MSLLFKPHHIPLIRDGTKIATRRVWADNYPRPNLGTVRGAITEMFTPKEEIDCWIRITGHYREPLGAMADSDYEAEGGYSREEFEQVWRDINGEYDPTQVVDVVEFRYEGRTPNGAKSDGDTNG